MFGFGKNKGKVFVGLSGGVDSAVAAALLQSQGYAVTGVFIRIVVSGYPCTAGEDRIDAMRVVAHLKIPFVEVDFSEGYEKKVFRPSIAEFKKGKTPNPDVICNREVKFGDFFEFAQFRGADFIATGHYAQLRRGLTSAELHAGADKNKDQSYFLWAVPETVLRHTLFPIGNMQKEQVRAYAKKIGLPNAERPDSQGLCFLGPVSITEMLEKEIKLKWGNVLSEDGRTIGRHRGVSLYTLGQRHGFELSPRSPHEAPYFVVAKDIKKNTITVSTSRFPRSARETQVWLRDTNWIGDIPLGPCEARFRYRQKLISSEFTGSSVILHEPHFVPIGQSLVLYKNNRCLGGGVIESATLK